MIISSKNLSSKLQKKIYHKGSFKQKDVISKAFSKKAFQEGKTCFQTINRCLCFAKLTANTSRTIQTFIRTRLISYFCTHLLRLCLSSLAVLWRASRAFHRRKSSSSICFFLRRGWIDVHSWWWRSSLMSPRSLSSGSWQQLNPFYYFDYLYTS